MRLLVYAIFTFIFFRNFQLARESMLGSGWYFMSDVERNKKINISYLPAESSTCSNTFVVKALENLRTIQ